MGRHRLEPSRRVRPRLGRMAAAAASLTVTLVALLGGLGVIPLQTARGGGEQQSMAGRSHQHADGGASGTETAAASAVVDPTALPADSGTGRRVVFARNAQRVWLVAADGSVAATYLVSGSVTDNLAPGRYHVYSRSRWAVGVQDSGVMQYFVRFARGDQAAIGFHSIPTKHGRPLQTVAQLGTPQSHGCIRQKLSDAVRMWDFAPVGTDVVVVA